MKHIRTILYAVLIVSGPVTLAWSGDVPEHPLIRPYSGSVLAQNMSNYQEFNAAEFYVFDEATKKRCKKTVKGKYWRLLYEVRTPGGERVRDISRLEFLENFKAAALDAEGRVAYEDQSLLVFTIPNNEGGTTWCQVTCNAGLGQTYLTIVDEAVFKKSLTFGPAEMKATLVSEGRIQLYDIFFDLDKATLQPESTSQLQHVVILLKENPDLRLEVQGHTDDQGADDYNLELSQRRAETVVTYLGIFGIDTGRLTAKGFGESKPVMSNTTEEGRAKNRRVELVKTTP